MDKVAERIRSLAEAACAQKGIDLVDVSLKRGRTTLLCLTVDSDKGVDVDTCAAVSNALGRMLDADDPLPERYTLEVATPGADRPLKTPRDFRRNIGRPLSIKTADQEIVGDCLSVDEESVTINTPQGEKTLTLESIEDARVVLPW